MTTVTLYDLGTQGIHRDIPPHLLAPEVWSDGNNVRFIDGYAQRALGYSNLYDSLAASGFIFNVPGLTESFWLTATLGVVRAYSGGTIATIGSGFTTSKYRDWNGCLLGGVPILNNYSDVPHYWSNIAFATPLANLPAWPVNMRARIIRNFGRFLVAINIIDGGSLLPHAVQWSHPADPGSVPSSWDNTDPAVDAGRTHLTDAEGGELQNGLLLGNQLVLYKQRSTHLMRFIGGSDIFGFDLLFNQGVYSPRSAAIIDSGRRHFVVGGDDIYVHSGTRDVQYPLDKKTRRTLYAEISEEHKLNSFCYENPFFEEACFVYPTIGNEWPNKEMFWNYRSGAVGFRDRSILATASGDFTVAQTSWDALTGSWDTFVGPWNIPGTRRILGVSPANANKTWGIDLGFTYGDNLNTVWSLQRTGIAIIGKGRDGQPKADYTSQKLGKRIWPKYRGEGQLQVRMGGQDEINGAITWQSFRTFDPALKFVDFEVNARLLAIEFRGTEDKDARVEGFDLEFEVLGGL